MGLRMHRRDQEKIAVQCLLELECMGISVEVVQDFRRVPSLLAQLGRPLGAANNPEKILMTQTNALWVVGSRLDETQTELLPLIGCGIRVDDLGQEDVQSFVGRSIEVLFDVKVTGVTAEIFSGRRWGRAAYVGALTSGLTLGLGRSARKVVQLVMAYAHYRAFTDLGSDVNYCFLRQSDGGKGVTYGFLNAETFVWKTDELMFPDGNPGWIMSTSRGQAVSVMLAAASLLPQGLGVNQKLGLPAGISNTASGH